MILAGGRSPSAQAGADPARPSCPAGLHSCGLAPLGCLEHGIPWELLVLQSWFPAGITSWGSSRLISLVTSSQSLEVQVGPKCHSEAAVTCSPSKARVLPLPVAPWAWTLRKGPLASPPRAGSRIPSLQAGPTVVQCMLGAVLLKNPSSGAVTRPGRASLTPRCCILLTCGSRSAPQCINSAGGRMSRETAVPALPPAHHCSILPQVSGERSGCEAGEVEQRAAQACETGGAAATQPFKPQEASVCPSAVS